MNTVIRNIVAYTYKPLLERYLSKTRSYTYSGIQMRIPPDVFHPGFFFSTQLLLRYIRGLDLENKSLLEPGCGSGLISLYAASRGARVTATDINPVAIEYIHRNCRENKIELKIIESDLFAQLAPERFDIIAINPPYYKKQPVSLREYAWYCGEKGEYFEALFQGLNNYIHTDSGVFMILFEGCDQRMVQQYAAEHGFVLNLLQTHQNLLEKNFIYKIIKYSGSNR